MTRNSIFQMSAVPPAPIPAATAATASILGVLEQGLAGCDAGLRGTELLGTACIQSLRALFDGLRSAEGVYWSRLGADPQGRQGMLTAVLVGQELWQGWESSLMPLRAAVDRMTARTLQ